MGIAPAREAVAADSESRGMPVVPDRVILTAGTSEGIELALGAMADAGDEVLVPTPTYPLYTAVLAKLGDNRRERRLRWQALALQAAQQCLTGQGLQGRALREKTIEEAQRVEPEYRRQLRRLGLFSAACAPRPAPKL